MVCFPSGASRLDYLADHAILPGMLLFSRFGYALARRFWTEPAGTLYGRKVVLTGGTSGIGKAAAFRSNPPDHNPLVWLVIIPRYPSTVIRVPS